MNHRNCFEVLDRSLKDILQLDNPDIDEKSFGGKTILLGRDFRQILLVVFRGRRVEKIDASINRSYL